MRSSSLSVFSACSSEFTEQAADVANEILPIVSRTITTIMTTALTSTTAHMIIQTQVSANVVAATGNYDNTATGKRGRGQGESLQE